VAGIIAVQLVTITLAGYAFARYRFRYQNVLLFLILAQLMVPSSALIVPNYTTVRQLHLFDTLLAVMLPYFGSAFGVFLVRQTFKTVPRALDDAARVDRCGLAAHAVARVPTAGASRARRLRPFVDQLSLERLPLAARRHEQRGEPPAHCWPRCVSRSWARSAPSGRS